MKSTLLAFVLSIISGLAFAQNKLTGKVLDQQSNPIVGASIHLLNTNIGTITDAQGAFALQAGGAGTYSLSITAVGYASVQQEIKIGDADEALTVSLKESTSQLDEIVVTAQKREEELQKVPVSISSLSSKQIEQYRIWNTKDITAIVPNLYSANPGDNRNVTSIRGITSTSYDPSVVTYVDGVNQFSLDTYIAQLFDVERIEVLRGPQGTLYGRNAMGGVINIITKQPTNKTTGFSEINVGNNGQRRHMIGIRTPLVKDKLFLGVSLIVDRSNGFYKNQLDGSHFDKNSSLTGNYYLKYLANRQWVFTLNVKHNDNRNNGTFPLSYSPFTDPFTVNQNAVTTMHDNTFNTSLSENYAGNRLNFSSQTTYQSNYRYYPSPIDGDFSPIDGVTIINNYGRKWNNVKVLTHEFKFSSPASSTSKLQWTAGTYLFYQHNPTKQSTHFGADAAYVGAPQPFFSTIGTSTAVNEGIAFYGQAVYAVSDKVDLTAGLRYDYEHKKLSVLGEYQPDGQPAITTRSDTSATASYSAISPKLSLHYHLTENSHLYAAYTRGFRTGGLTSLSSDPSQPPLYSYKPEYSNNIEAGFKNTFFDNRLRINATAFYIDLSNAQVPTLVLPAAITVTRNTGSLTSKGVEMELSTTPLKGLQLDYNYGLTHATYQSLNLSQNGAEVNLQGKRQLFTPASTSMLAAQYSLGLGAAGKVSLVVRGEWMNIGTQYFDLANTIRQPSYNLLNTRVGVATRKGFEVMFWMRNLADKKYIAYAYDFGAAHLGNPKTYGITVRKNFRWL